jgi:peroxiredoxin
VVLHRLVLVLVSMLLLGPVPSVGAAPAAPGFKVRTVDGKTTLDSRDLIGKKILVLRFQASYCKPCGRESAGLARVYERYRSRGVEVLALHVQDTTADTRAFARRHRVTYPIALDPKLTIGNPFGFKGTPYTVVIDRKGEMVVQAHGQSVVGRLPKILDDLLKQEPAQPSS